MLSLLAASGVNVDRAFPGLGPAAADRRRALAITGLVNIVRTAESVGAETILIVGGLFDDRTVSTTAMKTVVPLLNAFAGRVLIAPGAQDPYTPQGPHSTTEWGPRTSVWTSVDFADPLATGPVRVLGRALRPGGSGVPAFPHIVQGDGCVVLAGAELPVDRCVSWAGDGPGRHVVTTGPQETLLEGLTVLEDVNPSLGSAAGNAALILLDGSNVVSVEFKAVLEAAAGAVVPVDMSEITSTDALLGALNRAVSSAPAWSVVRLMGIVRQGVLLPALAGRSHDRDDVRVDMGDLSFAFEEPESSDHTAMSEFVRSLSRDSADDRSRHQAIALGLAAFEASAREQAEP
ncbi:hypothetical protein [Agromyces sp. Marseille-Q5079]|uniref:hypothetical protein n=1 Tax=Agromyces sp. Marseille-Q5079 TaxID=3439059 RepID=UPI003D9C936E